MKTFTWIILFFLLLLPCACLAQTETKIQTQTLSLKDPSSSRIIQITVEYPVSPQARMSNLKGELVPLNNSRDQKYNLILSGKVENRLSRELRNAEVVIIVLDKNSETIDTLEIKVFPTALKDNNDFGRFTAEIPFSSHIASFKIEIIWQGKKTSP